jgi:hypothetical protein
MIKFAKLVSRAPIKRSFVAMACALSCAGCVSLENEEGRLPDAVRSAISGLTAKGYPDLTKIPDAPTNLPTAATWGALEQGLVAQGQSVAQNPGAVAPTAEELNQSWAQGARASLEADPRSQPVPPVAVGTQTELEAAAAARAKFDADLARLPPL